MPSLHHHTKFVPKCESQPAHRGHAPIKLTSRARSWLLYQNGFAQDISPNVLFPANSISLALEILLMLTALFPDLTLRSLA